MSSSDEQLADFVRAAAALRGLSIDESWRPAVAQHLKRLLEAAQFLDAAGSQSQDLAPRFEP